MKIEKNIPIFQAKSKTHSRSSSVPAGARRHTFQVPKPPSGIVLHIFSRVLTIYIPCNFPYNNIESFGCLLLREHSSCRQFIMYEKCGHLMDNVFIFKKKKKI